MSIYPHALRDTRVREYLPVRRIVLQQNVSNAGLWLNNPTIQLAIFPGQPCAEIAPGGFAVVDFGIELHGGIRLINRSEQCPVRLRFGESVSEACGAPDQCHAIHDTVFLLPHFGMQEYGATAFRFVRIDNPGSHGLQLCNITAVAQYRDLEYAGSFESSDERLNEIWKTARYTLLLNMQDYIYDGAKRDRLVWMGDLNIEIRGAFAAFSDLALVKKSLSFLVETTPLPNFMNNSPSYFCWWVISLADYFRHTGDLAYLVESREYLNGVLRMFRGFIREDGSENIPEPRFFDWESQDDDAAKHAGLQGLLYWMFRQGEFLLRTIGEDAKIPVDAQNLLRRHMPDCGMSKSAAAIQTVSSFYDRREILSNRPLQGIGAFLGYYMLEALSTDTALDVVRRFWGGMLDRGATTFWESFSIDWLKNSGRIDEITPPGLKDLHADFGDHCYQGLRHSLCHGWGCAPMAFLSERVLGVKFLSPGGTIIKVTPDLGDLEYVHGKYPCAGGVVEVIADRSGKVDVSAPAGVEIQM